MVGYPSGQRGQTVNLLAYAFAGSNPAPTTNSLYVRNFSDGNVVDERAVPFIANAGEEDGCKF
jgi:hypothetical protein